MIVTADTAYVRGDAFALVNYMGFNAVPAAKYANVWISIPRADVGYTPVAAAVRLSSLVQELKLSGPLSAVLKTTLAGQQVLGIKGSTLLLTGHTAVAILYARAAGSPLPMQETVRDRSTRSTITLSAWNEAVRVPAQAAAAPKATTGLEHVRAGTPADSKNRSRVAPRV